MAACTAQDAAEPRRPPSGARIGVPVGDDLDLFQRHEPFGEHLVQRRKNPANPILPVDELDDDRGIFMTNPRCLHDRMRAVPAPSHTARRPTTTFPRMFRSARAKAPPRIRSRVSYP